MVSGGIWERNNWTMTRGEHGGIDRRQVGREGWTGTRSAFSTDLEKFVIFSGKLRNCEEMSGRCNEILGRRWRRD